MCSPISQFSGHFLLLDIGHPMTQACIVIIKESLINILSLASCLKGTSRIPVFGCGTLEAKLIILQELKFLYGNYMEMERNMENMENIVKLGIKCTVKDYKTHLEASILKIVTDFESKSNDWKMRTSVKDQFNRLKYWPTKIRITLITKKSALPIQKMLEEVSSCSKKLKEIEIVEISNDEDDEMDILTEHTDIISCSTVSESISDLDGLFKKWILEEKPECEQLRIILNRESSCRIKCDVKEYFLDPEILAIYQSYSQSGIFRASLPDRLLIFQGINLPTCEMDVIKKLRISDVCSTTLFDVPKFIYATRSRNLSVAELRYNDQLFKALCTQLFQEKIGLLTKVKPMSDEITAFHFIISDGEKLIIKNIIPMELQLPFRPEPLKFTNPDNEGIDFVVHSLLDRVQTAQEISPDKYSFGIYDHLKKHLKSESENDKKFERFQNARCRKIKEITSFPKTDIPPGEYTRQFLEHMNFSSAKFCNKKENIKRLKKNSGHHLKEKRDIVEGVIHPALLSPESTAKYRKFHCHKFLLPELLVPGVVEK